jgi:hypothetical protein
MIGVIMTQQLKIEAIIPELTPLLSAKKKHAIMTICYQPWMRPLMMGTQKQIQLSSYLIWVWYALAKGECSGFLSTVRRAEK